MDESKDVAPQPQGGYLSRAGRPKGCRDKIERRQRKFLKLSFWFRELQKDWPTLKPIERANLCADFIRVLMSKMSKLPSSPTKSVQNVDDLIDALGQLEGAPSGQSNDSKKVQELTIAQESVQPEVKSC